MNNVGEVNAKTIIAVIIYALICVAIFVLTSPDYYCFATWWETLIVVATFAIAAIILLSIDNQSSALDAWTAPSKFVDIWTILHFLAGCILGLFTPFVWMVLLNIGYEILEIIAKGLGDLETNTNRVGDVLFTICGWVIVVISFYYQFRMNHFPWVWGDGCTGWPFAVDQPSRPESAFIASHDDSEDENVVPLMLISLSENTALYYMMASFMIITLSYTACCAYIGYLSGRRISDMLPNRLKTLTTKEQTSINFDE